MGRSLETGQGRKGEEAREGEWERVTRGPGRKGWSLHGRALAGGGCPRVDPGYKGFRGTCLSTCVCQQLVNALVYVMPRGSGCDTCHPPAYVHVLGEGHRMWAGRRMCEIDRHRRDKISDLSPAGSSWGGVCPSMGLTGFFIRIVGTGVVMRLKSTEAFPPSLFFIFWLCSTARRTLFPNQGLNPRHGSESTQS